LNGTLDQRGRSKILSTSNITATQIGESLLAIPAFLPATVCTGYILGWFTNLHDFRQRSLVERIFWSLPLSLALSTISAVLIGNFLSLSAVVVFYAAASALFLAIVAREGLQLRRFCKKWNVGFHPLGGKALTLVILWTVGTILSLVDIQVDHKLYVSVAMLDQSYRVNWTESVLHTGVPPANPLYMYGHPAPMRNYYFWYVLCAAVAKMTNLPVRPVFTASCVWAGFAFAALIGLFLKYYLLVGARLRRQFLLSIALLGITGLDVGVVLWNLFYFHVAPPADLEAWSRDGIVSWLHTLFWAPHHLVSMLCCMFAFLLAWTAGATGKRDRIASVVLIALALSSAFGLSIYVTFAFFLAMVVWAIWQVAIERLPQPALLLAVGGALSLLLLIPYFRELLHSDSNTNAGRTGAQASLFSFAVRQMIPPDGLLGTQAFRSLAAVHPLTASNLAKLILIVPGYALELGFFLAVLLIYLIPAWRNQTQLTSAQRSLVWIAAATFPFMSFIRSGVLQTNDFAWRAAVFVQFPLLLLASELLTRWSIEDNKPHAPRDAAGLPGSTPRWLRSIASLALVIGVFSTICQALMFRFLIPLGDMASRASGDPYTRNLSQKAYISSVGYAQLNAVIPQNAVVQFNPEDQGRDRMSMIVNMLGIDHQTAIAADYGSCGSDLGGDSAGCPFMADSIDRVFSGTSAEQAQAICKQFGIQYLVVRVYDPVWQDKNGWVWTLKPVVSESDFRAMDCK
jgi:hypothetical protein